MSVSLDDLHLLTLESGEYSDFVQVWLAVYPSAEAAETGRLEWMAWRGRVLPEVARLREAGNYSLDPPGSIEDPLQTFTLQDPRFTAIPSHEDHEPAIRWYQVDDWEPVVYSLPRFVPPDDLDDLVDPDKLYVSVCHECAAEIDDPEINSITAANVEDPEDEATG